MRIRAATNTLPRPSSTSVPPIALPIRNSRACTALAFCPSDPNYLAVGLDKVRGDPGLYIWDISSNIPSLISPPSATSDVASDRYSVPPPSPVASPHRTEFPQIPRLNPLLPRYEPPTRTDHRVQQSHAIAEAITALAFLKTPPTVLLAGLTRNMRLYDLRAHIGSFISVATRVQGIALDPLDERRCACWGEGVVTLWDIRKMSSAGGANSTPVMTFSSKDAAADGAVWKPTSTFSHVEFSPSRPGTLATMERDAHCVRFWDIRQATARELSAVAESSSSKEHSRSRSPSSSISGSFGS